MDCLSRQGLKPLYRYLFVWREAGTVPSCLVSRSNESLYSGLVQNCRICKTGINLSVVNSGLIPQDQFLTPSVYSVIFTVKVTELYVNLVSIEKCGLFVGYVVIWTHGMHKCHKFNSQFLKPENTNKCFCPNSVAIMFNLSVESILIPELAIFCRSWGRPAQAQVFTWKVPNRCDCCIFNEVTHCAPASLIARICASFSNIQVFADTLYKEYTRWHLTVSLARFASVYRLYRYNEI